MAPKEEVEEFEQSAEDISYISIRLPPPLIPNEVNLSGQFSNPDSEYQPSE